jgi:hypothetical protein
MHILGSAVGGLLCGSILGWVGQIFSLPSIQVWTISFVLLIALWYAIKRPLRPLGLNRQVPREWSKFMPVGIRYFLWGVLLGSGIATLIPHSLFLVVFAYQLTSGLVAAALAGLCFGITRGVCTSLLLLLNRGYRLEPPRLVKLLHIWLKPAQKTNMITIIVVGTLFLTFVLK